MAGDVTVRFAVAAVVLAWQDPFRAQRREQQWRLSGTVLAVAEEQIAGDVFFRSPVAGAVWDRGWWRCVPKQSAMTQLALTGHETAIRKVCITGSSCRPITDMRPVPLRDVIVTVGP